MASTWRATVDLGYRQSLRDIRASGGWAETSVPDDSKETSWTSSLLSTYSSSSGICVVLRPGYNEWMPVTSRAIRSSRTVYNGNVVTGVVLREISWSVCEWTVSGSGAARAPNNEWHYGYAQLTAVRPVQCSDQSAAQSTVAAQLA